MLLTRHLLCGRKAWTE